MTLQATFQLRELGQDMAVAGDGATHTHKSENYKYAHFDGAFGVQDRRSHDGAVFSKDVWKITRAAVPFT